MKVKYTGENDQHLGYFNNERIILKAGDNTFKKDVFEWLKEKPWFKRLDKNGYIVIGAEKKAIKKVTKKKEDNYDEYEIADIDSNDEENKPISTNIFKG